MSEFKDAFEGMEIPEQLKGLLGNIKLIIGGIAGVIFLFSSLYTVEPEEVGVVQRFGEYVRTAEPGLNFKIPLMETARIVPVERQLKQEFGYRTVQSGIQSQYRKAGFQDESLMLTGDLNLADVEWVVQYRISDPYNYLFKVRNPEKTLRDMSEAAMRQVVGNRTVNEVLTIGRAAVALRVQEILQELNIEYETGVRIEQVVLQDLNPPDPVKPSFNAVNEAQQQRETLINQARSDYNRVIPRARGQALQTIQQAEGYAINRTNTALGEVAAFNAVHLEYLRAPEITKRRIYYETMQDLLPRLGNKVITDQDGTNVLPLLQMQMNSTNPATQNQTGN
ncbi:MAG: FtsH protease activity modulator HflK [Balneolaceae bacterium]|nr:MAG: FtsH protease activity modulator HflK [Balneolaceae bacterium]